MINKSIHNVDFSQFEDEFKNLKYEFEVIRFGRRTSGEWIKEETISSSRNWYTIDSKLYFRCDNTLSPANMDFDSITCGACYTIGKEIINTRKITGNEILITNDYLSLHKQSYADKTSFYTLEDVGGNWHTYHGSSNLHELIQQLRKEIEIDARMEEEDWFKNNIGHQDLYYSLKNRRENLIKQIENI